MTHQTRRILIPIIPAVFLLLTPVLSHGEDFDFSDQSLTDAENEFEFTQTRTCQPSGINQCNHGQTPLPVQWGRLDIPFVVNVYGSQNIHPDDDELTDELRDGIIDSFEVWNQQQCSDFEMLYEGTTPGAPPPYYDQNIPHDENENVVNFKDESWPHENYQAVALTTVTFRPSSGEILGADIEMNTADYDFSNADEPGGEQVDLRNTMTHEAGHFLGLDHSPNSEATMWQRAQMGETKKRQLHDADIAGICYIYPSGESAPDFGDSPTTSEPDSDSRAGCGCAATDSGGLFGGAPLAAVLMLLGLSILRRGSRE